MKTLTGNDGSLCARASLKVITIFIETQCFAAQLYNIVAEHATAVPSDIETRGRLPISDLPPGRSENIRADTESFFRNEQCIRKTEK